MHVHYWIFTLPCGDVSTTGKTDRLIRLLFHVCEIIRCELLRKDEDFAPRFDFCSKNTFGFSIWSGLISEPQLSKCKEIIFNSFSGRLNKLAGELNPKKQEQGVPFQKD